MKRIKRSTLTFSLLLATTLFAAVIFFAFPNSVTKVQAIGDEPLSVVIASGLNNPRGINFGPDGNLYVAEAGSGGEGPCQGGAEGENCFGYSGSITKVRMKDLSQERVVTELPSIAAPDGSFALGPHDVSFQGLGNGYITIGLGNDPAIRPGFGPGGSQLASLFRFTPGKSHGLVADLGDYEANFDPNGDGPDSDPYGLLALPSRQVYTDAGGNALNQRSAKGNLSTLAVFPDRLVLAPPFLGLPAGTEIPMDAVPTTVAVGPDGAFYVGQLTGFPFPVGGAKIYRVPANGGTPTVYATGFTAVIDIAFGPDGSLYVVEIAKHGLLAAFSPAFDFEGGLFRVPPGGGSAVELDNGELFAPGGVAIGSNGSLYVTNNGIFTGAGEVRRFDQ